MRNKIGVFSRLNINILHVLRLLYFYKSFTMKPLMAAPTAKPKTKKETKKEAARPWSTPFCSIFGPYIIAMLPMYPLEIEKTTMKIK